jgi:glutamyl-tRNA reductase
LLERFAVSGDRLRKYLDALVQSDHISEAVILSTCHRTEVWAVAERFHGAYSDVRDLLCDLTYLPPEDFSEHLTTEYDLDAVQHLFEVAAGLDSVVVGEHEILGQIADAWAVALEVGSAGPSLNLLFRHAVEVGKRARTETAIARGVTSVSQAAVVMATERLGTLSGARAAVLGAGNMGRGMVTLLADQDIEEVVVLNRSLGPAEALAHPVGGRALELGALAEELVRADVLFTSTGAAEPVVTAELLAEVLPIRTGRDLLIVDIAVPRDVDPAVADLDGVTLLDMDSLEAFAQRGLTERRAEIPAVTAIVESELARYESARTSRQVAPLVGELHQWAESIRVSELDRFRSRLDGLDDTQREAVEATTRGIVAKLLHHATIAVKDASGTPRGERLAASLRDLFDL